jgi:hypothetical protein
MEKGMDEHGQSAELPIPFSSDRKAMTIGKACP